MEAGANPARSRHCNGGALFRTSLKSIDMPQIACRFGKTKSVEIPESGDMHSLIRTAVPEKRRRCKRSKYGLQFIFSEEKIDCSLFDFIAFHPAGYRDFGNGAPLPYLRINTKVVLKIKKRNQKQQTRKRRNIK